MIGNSTIQRRSTWKTNSVFLFDEPPISTIWEKILELGDLKKNFCQCIIHQEDREVNLLYQLKLHNTGGNRELAKRVLKSKPLGFPALISSCKQVNGTPSQCNLLLYEVTPTTAGTFKAVEQHCMTTTTSTNKE